jgi:type VI secretion system secreted protein VgrG
MDEKSSCWIHVSQPWGGTGYGGVNLPRVGQEVIVDFLGGDPDRPVVIGRVYTNLQRVPYRLPDHKTQSGWRSSSTGGSGGYNEMMFEDAAGQELVRMQAEKDMHTLVKNDEEHTVGRDRTRSVQRNESVSIGKNRTKQVAENEQVTIGQNHRVAVGINRSTEVGTTDVTRVGHTHVVMISPPGELLPDPASSWVMTRHKIVLGTGAGATFTLEDGNVSFECKNMSIVASDQLKIMAKDVNIIGTSTTHLTGASEVMIVGGEIDVHTKGTVKIQGGEVDVWGTPIKLNC